MKVKSIEEIQNALQPIADELSVEIVDVEFKQGREPALTIYIDVEGGVDLNTCETFHRAIDTVLDEVDPTFGAPYTLNVSSPGVDRPLKTKRDFEKCMGKQVEVKLFAPMMGKKFFEPHQIYHIVVFTSLQLEQLHLMKLWQELKVLQDLFVEDFQK